MKILTNDWVVVFESPNFKDFSESSDKEKRLTHLIDGMPLPTQTLIKIYQKEKNIVMAMREVICVLLIIDSFERVSSIH